MGCIGHLFCSCHEVILFLRMSLPDSSRRTPKLSCINVTMCPLRSYGNLSVRREGGKGKIQVTVFLRNVSVGEKHSDTQGINVT